jgi:hypothetical protein
LARAANFGALALASARDYSNFWQPASGVEKLCRFNCLAFCSLRETEKRVYPLTAFTGAHMFHAVNSWDLEFARERVRCASAIGAPVHHWIPFGMPKLKRDIFNAVFYLYREEPTPSGKNKITGPWGTGSVIGRPIDGTRFYHLYGVTNRHIAHKAGASIIRINTKDGKTRCLEYQPDDWQFIPQQDDIAVVDITDDLVGDDDEIALIGEREFISEKILGSHEIGPGDDVFMIGLFSDAHGGKRNVPIVRFGNIAMIANNNVLIEENSDLPMRPCHLTDMRSKAGFSGSPVFVYRIPEMDLDRPPGSPLQLKSGQKFLALLGIHCGQFWERTKVYKDSMRKNEGLGDPIKEGDALYIQGAVNIVIPAWRITEVLDLKEFDVERKKREPRLREEDLRLPQPESAEVASPTDDVNHNHLEDFKRLVDVAARKRTRDDQS